MKKHNKTEVDVASRTHVSPRTVHRFLAGSHELRPVVLNAFAQMITESEAADKQDEADFKREEQEGR